MTRSRSADSAETTWSQKSTGQQVKSTSLLAGFSFYDFCLEALSRVWGHWSGSLSKFWDQTFARFLVYFPLRMTDFAVVVVDELANLANSFAGAVGLSVRESILKRVPTPPSWSWRVMTMEQAFNAVVQLLLIDAPRDMSGSFPLSLSLQSWASRWVSFFGGKSKVSFWIKRLIPNIFKLTWLKVIAWLYKFVLLVVSQVVQVVCILVVAGFVLRCFSEDPPLKPLSQGARRRKRRLVGGGVIRRREPGGVAP